jgi:hypothetical protein
VSDFIGIRSETDQQWRDEQSRQAEEVASNDMMAYHSERYAPSDSTDERKQADAHQASVSGQMLENKIADELNERLEQQLKNKLKNFLHTLILPNDAAQ